MDLLSVKSLSCLADYGESEESIRSPTTSETGEVFLFKGNESRNSSPSVNMNLNSEKSHQKVKTPDSCSPRSRMKSDLEIFSLLEDCYFLNENHSTSFCSPTEGLSKNEILHMMDEEEKECMYPNLFNYPTLVTLVPLPESAICQIIDKEDAPYPGNLFDPERRLDIYRAFVRHLGSSDFPFSKKQLATRRELSNKVLSLHKLSRECGEEISCKCRKEELELKSELDLFIDLLEYTDYEDTSPILINRYIAAMISELEFWTEDEKKNPISTPKNLDYFFFDPASYLIHSLVKAFPDSTEEKMEENFFAKRKESHLELVRILTTSKFPFTSSQKSIIQEISQFVTFTIGDPDSAEERNFQDLVGKLLLVLNFNDEGPRDGISNVKKVRRAYNRLIDDILNLEENERRFLREFEHFSLHSADLVRTIVETLRLSFIPRHSERLFRI